MGKNRNHWLDNAKFILIILVILWHCSERFTPGPVLTNSNTMMSFFRMPLFIFLSGLFTRKMEWSRFGGQLWGIIETYLVFTLILSVPVFLQGSNVSISLFLEPRWTLWYLMSLCLWRLWIQLFAGVLSPKWLLILSVIFGCLSGFIHLGPVLSLQRTVTLAPFFMTGYYCGRNSVDLSKVRRIPISVSLVFLSLLWIGCLMVKSFPLRQFLNGSVTYAFFDGYSPLVLTVLRLVQYALCVFSSVCVLRLIPTKESWLSVQGRNTLYYYVFHTPIILGIAALGDLINLPGSSFAILLYTSTIVFVICLLVKIPFFRAIPRIFTRLYEFVFRNHIQD